jgi:protein regulator of cytokinesis 1
LNEEIQRCEELKHQNIERFIDRMRNELRELWEKCCVSEEEQAAFEPFNSSDFSDELLDAHEAEVRRLETYFTANRPIFELLGRRAELWERMAVLEAKAHDKDRLFQNRGGQLLKEEKERKQLQKVSKRKCSITLLLSNPKIPIIKYKDLVPSIRNVYKKCSKIYTKT